jgi:hypothetical protein
LSSSTRKQSLSSPTDRPQILGSETAASAQCRCGTRIPEGGAAFRISPLPLSLEAVFDSAAFCSPTCVRAFCLEALEMLDALDTPDAKATVSDLHELTMEVATMLVSILGA